MEFNDRSSKFNQSEEKPEVRSKKSTDSSFDNDWDERLRKFHERLRFSEDLSMDQKIRARDRRTYSDDYEDMSRRQSHEEHFVSIYINKSMNNQKLLSIIMKVKFTNKTL